ncbi:hypothetical protein JYT20_00165 [Rhodothermus sp. AH-315-K08]|nr:hypothetical protein [Rhodothermus sp. AH-315-K08]
MAPAEEKTVERTRMIAAALAKHRSEYLGERTLLIEGEQKAAEQFAKAMLALSTAALGFSLALVGTETVALSAKGCLYSSWIAFALAVVATIRSLYCSQLAYRESREKLDHEHQPSGQALYEKLADTSDPDEALTGVSLDPAPHPVPEWAREIEVYHGLSLFCVVAGVVSLIAFSIINL